MQQRQAALAFQTAPKSQVCKPYIGFYARLTPHALFLSTIHLCLLCLPTSPRIEIESLLLQMMLRLRVCYSSSNSVESNGGVLTSDG